MSASIIDYIVLAAVLLLSLGIGLFYSFRQKTTEEYLHGGHKMLLVPVAVSLVVSFVSTITMQGLPAEIYLYGIDLMCGILGSWGMILCAFTFLPILYEMKPTSIYEYLEERYQSKRIKVICSGMSAVCATIYSGVVIFGPASALENFLGIPTEYNIIAMTVICTIYTSLGGIRAVVWTDVLQAVIMILGLIVILIVGLYHVGLEETWNELSEHGRTHIELSPDITKRYNVWIGLVSSGFFTFAMFLNQTAMMRYTGLPTERQAKASIFLGAIGFSLLQQLAIAVGAVVFAYYAKFGCGPLEGGYISSPNQIIPYFVMNVVNFPGIPGLFVAALVSSTLSTVSSAENSVTAVVWKDLLSPFFPRISEFKKTIILKLLVLSFGIAITSIALAAMQAGGTIFQINAIATGTVAIPLCGMLLLGGISPYPSASVAIISWISASLFMLWITLGKIFYGTQWEKPVLLTENCSTLVNELHYNTSSTFAFPPSQTWDQSVTSLPNVTTSTLNVEVGPSSGLLQFYSISPYAYPFLAISISVTVGLLLSLFPCLRQKGKVNPGLLIPWVRKCFASSMEDSDKKMEEVLPHHEPLMEIKT